MNKSILREATRMLETLGIPEPLPLVNACRSVVSSRNFALRLRHQPRLRRRLLTWACAEEQRVHAEIAALCCMGRL